MFGLQNDLIVGFQVAERRRQPRMTAALLLVAAVAAARVRRPDGRDRRGARRDLPCRPRRARRERPQRGIPSARSRSTPKPTPTPSSSSASSPRPTAAVLVTVAFTLAVRQHLVGDARRRRAHDRRSRSSSSARARARSDASTPKGCCAQRRPVIRGVRIILGPLAHGLVALGNRVTPGRRPRLVLRLRGAAAQHHRRSRRERAHRGGRPRAHPLGLRLHRHVRARGDGAAHRHGHGGCLGVDARGDGDLPREGRLAHPDRRRRRRRRGRRPLPKDLVQFGFRDEAGLAGCADQPHRATRRCSSPSR